MMICKKCALENDIVRIRGKYEMGICPSCYEYCALYALLNDEMTKRAQALVGHVQFEKAVEQLATEVSEILRPEDDK